MTGGYIMTVSAETAEDATDIVKRRARDDGFRIVTVKRVHLTNHGKWTVELAIQRRDPS